MLPDQISQLLTAYVDGELPPRQREAVNRLLNQSAEARDFLRQLQENAHRLKSLPRRSVQPSLVDEIMRAISETQIEPRRSAVRRSGRRGWLPYVAASLAASVLIGAIGLIYWNNMGDPRKKHTVPIAKEKEAPILEKRLPEKVPIPTPEPLNSTPPPTPVPSNPAPKTPNPLLAELVKGTYLGFGAPVPVDPLFTAKFSDLQKDAIKAGQLTRELNKDKIMQLDITVKNNTKAVDHLRAVLAERGIKLVTDPHAAKSLKEKNQAKVEYLVYAENISSDELTKLLSELSKPATVPGRTNQTTEPSSYQRMTVAPAAKSDKQKVARLLGVEPGEIESIGNTEIPPDPKVVRQAVVLPATAGATRSSEIRQFVNQRRGQFAGTVQVLIRIRQE